MQVSFSRVHLRLQWRTTAREELDRLIARLVAILGELEDGGDVAQPKAQSKALPTPQANSREAELQRIHVEVRARFERLSAQAVGTSREGIRVVDPKTLETERYRIQFENAHTIRITDLRSGEYTRVWGDPHVDLSTIEGNRNGEFSDLKASQDVTTFLLKDGTRIRFQAPDTGLIERVDVTRGGTRISGVGMEGDVGVGVFHEIGSACDVSSDAGDVVTAGDDGASWYDERGRLVWGAKPSPPPPCGTPPERASVARSSGL
jgi:hypothetical protein